MPALLPGRRRRAERPDPLPDAARRAAVVERGEQVLAHARLLDGGWAVATSHALVLLPADGGAGGVARTGWHEVAEATWDPERRALDVRLAADEPGTPPAAVRLDDRPGTVPEVLRERVMNTYVLSQRVTTRGRRGFTVAVRRVAGADTLFVQVVADEGVNLQRREVAEQVDAVTRDLAEQVGLRLEA